MSLLANLNEQARAKAISLDDVDWQRPIDETKLWVPWELCPLYFTKVYDHLTDEEKLSDNHIYAMSLAEQFIFLEDHILNKVMVSLQQNKTFKRQYMDDPELGEAMQHLYDEEVVHAEMFWRLCEKAQPETYSKREFVLLPVTSFRTWAVHSIFSRPLLFPFWTWVGALFEEKTIYFSQLYEKYSGEEMDATFARVHRLHMIDEARHFALERQFVKMLWTNLSRTKRALNLHCFKSFLKNFIHPIQSSMGRFDALVKKHPHLEKHRALVLSEVKSFPRNEKWMEASFSARVLPGCFRMFKEHPDIDQAMKSLLA
jgi:hypothetical protein